MCPDSLFITLKTGLYMKYMNPRKMITFFLLFLPLSLPGRPVLETDPKDGVVKNWGELKLQIWTQNDPETEVQDTQKDPVYETVKKGLYTLKDHIRTYQKDNLLTDEVEAGLAQQSAEKAGEFVFRTSQMRDTEFYLDRQVRVLLENSLPKVLFRGDLLLKNKSFSLEKEQFTGLILRATGAPKPRAFYRITDETGKTLYSIKDVFKTSYQERLMGRWFLEPTREELLQAVGPQPISITFEEVQGGAFGVSGSAWDQFASKNKKILAESRIAVVIGGGKF
jgi:hypothetical protein